ncbi:hypothetical protein P9112_000469 [Eukaryota sp. TZLM1-RC]
MHDFLANLESHQQYTAYFDYLNTLNEPLTSALYDSLYNFLKSPDGDLLSSKECVSSLAHLFSNTIVITDDVVHPLTLLLFHNYLSSTSFSSLSQPLSSLLRRHPAPPPLIISSCTSALSSVHTPSKNIDFLRLVPSLLANSATPERSRLLTFTLNCTTSPSSHVRLLVSQSLPYLASLVVADPSKLKSQRAKHLNIELANKILGSASALLSDSTSIVKISTYKASILVLDSLPITPLSGSLASKLTDLVGVWSREFKGKFDWLVMGGLTVVIGNKFSEYFTKFSNGLMQQLKVSESSQVKDMVFKSLKFLSISSLKSSTNVVKFLTFCDEIFISFRELLYNFNNNFEINVDSKVEFTVDCSVIYSVLLPFFKIYFSDNNSKILVLSNLFELFLLISTATCLQSPHYLPKILSKFLHMISSSLTDEDQSVVKLSVDLFSLILLILSRPVISKISFNRKLISVFLTGSSTSRALIGLAQPLLDAHFKLSYSSWRQRLVYCRFIQTLISFMGSRENLDFFSGLSSLLNSNFQIKDQRGNQLQLPFILTEQIMEKIAQKYHVIKGQKAINLIDELILSFSSRNSTEQVVFVTCCGIISEKCSFSLFKTKFLAKFLEVVNDPQLISSVSNRAQIGQAIYNVKISLVTGSRLTNSKSLFSFVVDLESVFDSIQNSLNTHLIENFTSLGISESLVLWDQEEESRRISREQSNLIAIKGDDLIGNDSRLPVKGLSPQKTAQIDKKIQSFVV